MYTIYADGELLYSDIYPNHSRKVTSPTIKMGVDEAGSLEFTMSEVNKCYTKLERMKTIVTVCKNDIPFWDGRVVEEYRDWNKNKKMHVEGALTFLNDTTQPLKEYKNISLEELVTSILSVHNNLVDDRRKIFWGGIGDSFSPEVLEYWATSYEETFKAIKNLIDYFGCHLILKKDASTGFNKLYFFKNAMGVSNQTIMFGENLLDYTENYDLSKLATVILPLCKTNRESADEPKAVGTEVDLSHPQPYDETKHYGVLMARTNGYMCRKYLAAPRYANVPIPPYRNTLNLMAEQIDGAYTITKPDVLAIQKSDDGLNWTISEGVQIWWYSYATLPSERDGIDCYIEDEALACPLGTVPATNIDISFVHMLNRTPRTFTSDNYDSYYKQAETNDNGDLRNYRDRSSILWENVVDGYGIIHGFNNGQCAILEIDYTYYSHLYLTINFHSAVSENYRNISIWKKSKTFDESTSFVSRPIDRGERWIYASRWTVTVPGPGGPIYESSFYPAFAYTVGYKMPDGGSQWEDLVPDDDIPTILNQNKYTFVKDFGTRSCFESKIDLTFPFDPETDSPRILVVISGTNGPFGVTLVSHDDEQTDSLIAIGMDPNGVDLSKAHYIRYYQNDHNTWRPPGTGEEHDPYHFNANDIYDEEQGYGVLVPESSGYRLLTMSEIESLSGDPSFNVFNDGAINTSGVSNGIITSNIASVDHRVTVYVTKASYEDPDGKKFPNSIYITTKVKGKSGLYAIYEFTDGNGNNGVWDVNSGSKPSNYRRFSSIEYGKYINGYTTLQAKKITMPYAKDPNRLMFVIVGSTGENPKIHVHDPNQEEKISYLTIASANNGDFKLRADSSNRFSSALEYGDIDIQNGSLSSDLTYERLRTREPIKIVADGSYMLTFEKIDPDAIISADTYIYGKIDGYLGHTGFQVIRDQNPYILLPYLYEGYSLNVVFKKRYQDEASDTELTTNDILYPMIWRDEKSETLLLTQGSLTAVTDPVTNYVTLESDDTNTHVVSTADYYTTTDGDCTLKVSIVLDSSIIPSTVTVDGVQCIVKSRTVYISYLEQSPDIEIDSDGTTRHVVYKSYIDPHTIHEGLTFSILSKQNTRYKFYAYYDLEYEDENGVEHSLDYTDIEFLPSHVRTFSVVSYTDNHKKYVPPNDSYDKYGHIEKRIEFEDVESSAELKEKAEQYLYQSQFDEMTLKVKALDMSVVKPNEEDNLEIGYLVRAISPPHGLYRDFPITELSIPFDDVSGTTYELGYSSKDSLTKLIQGG